MWGFQATRLAAAEIPYPAAKCSDIILKSKHFLRPLLPRYPCSGAAASSGRSNDAFIRANFRVGQALHERPVIHLSLSPSPRHDWSSRVTALTWYGNEVALLQRVRDFEDSLRVVVQRLRRHFQGEPSLLVGTTSPSKTIETHPNRPINTASLTAQGTNPVPTAHSPPRNPRRLLTRPDCRTRAYHTNRSVFAPCSLRKKNGFLHGSPEAVDEDRTASCLPHRWHMARTRYLPPCWGGGAARMSTETPIKSRPPARPCPEERKPSSARHPCCKLTHSRTRPQPVEQARIASDQG